MNEIDSSKQLNSVANSYQQKIQVAIVGHVDHGKSTLTGRLLYDTDSLPEGKFTEIEEMSARRGMAFEFAFVMDAFQAERDQAITIDAAHIWFRSKQRSYVIVDAPGHREFIKNMVSGAASCDVALLVIDAHEGVREQSKRHAYLLHLLGINQVVVAVNKMDLVDYQKERFDNVEVEIRNYLKDISIQPTNVIPVVGPQGDNIVKKSEHMNWYTGPSILSALDQLSINDGIEELPFRMPVQDIYHFDSRRIIAGRVESGLVSAGDEIIFSPSNIKAVISTIEAWPEITAQQTAKSGSSIGITLKEQVFVERGEVMSHVTNPPLESNVLRGHIFWLSGQALRVGKQYRIKLATFEALVDVQSIDRIVNTDDLSSYSPSTKESKVEKNGVAEIVLRSKAMLPIDEYANNWTTGRFVLMDTYDIVGGGIISMKGYPDQRDLITEKGTNLFKVGHRVPVAARVQRNGHRGGVVWLTGLSGAGKSSIALEVERILFQKGYNVYLLDGDNIRSGLNANLTFSPEDRAENIRRVGEVAALFADAGAIVLTAFISPYRADRDRAREAVRHIQNDVAFHEVFVEASLQTCEDRDPKGLYKKARTGEVEDFTGVSAPYEKPDSPEIILDTNNYSLNQSVETLVSYILNEFNISQP